MAFHFIYCVCSGNSERPRGCPLFFDLGQLILGGSPLLRGAAMPTSTPAAANAVNELWVRTQSLLSSTLVTISENEQTSFLGVPSLSVQGVQTRLVHGP